MNSCESLAGGAWGWQGAACGALSQVPTPNRPYRACRKFTLLLLGCPPCDLNCHFKISALTLNPVLEQPSPAQPQAFPRPLGISWFMAAYLEASSRLWCNLQLDTRENTRK